MDFYALLDQVVALLRHRQRVTYRALQRQFNLDDAFLSDLKAELIEAQHLAADEDGNVLVWTGDTGATAASGVPRTEPQSTPLQVHQVVRTTDVQQRFDIAAIRGLTPLVGREHEVGLLRDRWAQVQAGWGHIVVLSGEAGIGKSRLVQVVKDEIIGAAAMRIESRCSPYHQHSALYPIITHLERALTFQRGDAPAHKLQEARVLLDALGG